MKEIIKSTGIILIFIGIAVLVFALMKHLDKNVWLIISGFLVIGGLLGHIVLNKYLT